MKITLIVVVVCAVIVAIGVLASARVVKQYERGVRFRLGRVIGVKEPGLRFIVPLIDRLPKVLCA